MSNKIKYLSLSLLAFFILIIAALFLSYSPDQPETPAVAAKKSYLQWSIYLFSGNPKACNLMTKEAQRAYVLESPFPTSECSNVVRRIRTYLDRKELFEPYAVSETFQKNIKRIALKNGKVLIFTLDFKRGQDPLIFENKDNKWLISKDSFIGKNSEPVDWINGRPD